MAKGITEYSKKIPGERGNYKWPVQFDITDKYVRIVQLDGEKVKDVVLLSPGQVRALLKFVGSH